MPRSGKAIASPPSVIDHEAELRGFELPPGISASWRLFTSALGTHAPQSMSRAADLGKALHRAIR